jgi:hypothetical protein
MEPWTDRPLPAFASREDRQARYKQCTYETLPLHIALRTKSEPGATASSCETFREAIPGRTYETKRCGAKPNAAAQLVITVLCSCTLASDVAGDDCAPTAQALD